MVAPGLFLAVLALVTSAEPDNDPIAALERRQQALFAAVAPSVVFIGGGDGFGSGFFVNDRGLVLTNHHVVGERKQVEVVLHDGRRLPGEVIERGEGDIDLALVQVAVTGVTPLALAVDDELAVGSWVGSVGHGGGGIWTFTTGMVSNFYAVPGERPIVQTQIPLNPGNSGGPIFDRTGRAVAIVNRGKANSNSINFGILVADAFERLAKLDAPCACLRITAPPKTPVFVDGEMIGQGPRLVLPPVPGRKREIRAIIGGQLRTIIATPSDTLVDLTAP